LPARKKREVRGVGRPRLPEGEARTERVVAFLRPDDLATLERIASERGVNVGLVARELLERALARRK
jgi:hypothetical protein